MRLECSHARRSRGQAAFTLAETLITCATLVIILGSVIMCNLFGISMAARQQIWLGASGDAAQAMSTLTGDIRSAVTMQVGSFQAGAFTQAAANGPQSGNALLIFTNSSTTTPWTLYYLDTTSNFLMRSNFYGSSGDSSVVSVNKVTNDVNHPIFTEVDYTGTAESNGVPLAAVNISLSFGQLLDGLIQTNNTQVNHYLTIEPGNTVDQYQILATVTPRLR